MLWVGAEPITSASANNSTAYRDNHVGFDEYDHHHEMSDSELQLAFRNLVNQGHLKDLTAGIPLQVSGYLGVGSEGGCRLECIRSIATDLNRLCAKSSEAGKESGSTCCASSVPFRRRFPA